MLQAGELQIIPQRGARAFSIHIPGALSIPDVLQVHRPEINAEARFPRVVGNGRMHLSCRKGDHSARRRHDADLGIELQGLFRLGLFAGILFDVLGRFLAAGSHPLLVIVLPGAIAHRLAEVPGMKGHDIAGLYLIDRQPPVDLAHRRRVPGVPVRMKGIGDAGSQITVAGRRAHARHVEIGQLRIAAPLRQDGLNAFFGTGMMDERRLEFREHCHVFLHRHLILGRDGVEAGKGFFDQLPGQLDEGQGGGGGGIDEELAGVEGGSSLVVGEGGVVVDGVHGV